MNLYSIPPLLTLLSFLGLGVLTLRQGRLKKADSLFCIICLLGSFLYIDILLVFHVQSAETALLISRTDHLFVVYLFPVYLHFFHTYLEVKNRKRMVYAAYAYSFVLMWLTRSPHYIASMKKHDFGYFAEGGVLFPLFGMSSLFVTVYALYLIHRAVRLEKSDVGKYKLWYMFIGFGMMGVLNALDILPIMGYSVYPPGNWSFIPLVVFGFGLFKHDLLGRGALIRKGLIYTLFTSFLTAIYAVAIVGAEKLTRAFNVMDSFYFSVVFIFLAAFGAAPLKEKIQIAVERFFFKGKYDYRKTIKAVGRTITSVLNVSDIARLILDAVSTSMQVEDCDIFVKESSGKEFTRYRVRDEFYTQDIRESDLPVIGILKPFRGPVFIRRLFDRRDQIDKNRLIAAFETLNAEIIFPFRVKEEMTGFISLGKKRSGDLFSSEELVLLEMLADQGALAFENAKYYHRLNRLNEDLEKEVGERTRELKQALYEKERSQEQLIRSESLAAIGQLVAGAAHELNNPLATVTSILQSSIEDLHQPDGKTVLNEDFVDDLRFAEKELKRAKKIVESLLGLSRQEQQFTERVNFNLVIQDALRVLHNQYKHERLSIFEHYAPCLPEIRGNFAHLGQVAINIIQNAIHAVRPIQGEVHLFTRYEEVSGKILFECRDSGPGVEKAHRLNIFKPFFTTKPEGQGTGLGLYICHEIVKKYGGTINLQDNDGHGANFVVAFPVKEI